MNRVAEEFFRRWWPSVRFFHRTSEDHCKLRAGRAKLGSRREREVELQQARQQKYAIEGGTAWQVEQMYRLEFLDEVASPILKHIKHGEIVCNRKGQVEIGPAIFLVERKRTNRGSRDDSRVGCCVLEHMLAHTITIFNAEHMDT